MSITIDVSNDIAHLSANEKTKIMIKFVDLYRKLIRALPRPKTEPKSNGGPYAWSCDLSAKLGYWDDKSEEKILTTTTLDSLDKK
jgi:hypothetical protein